jgi:hypothetical protein
MQQSAPRRTATNGAARKTKSHAAARSTARTAAKPEAARKVGRSTKARKRRVVDRAIPPPIPNLGAPPAIEKLLAYSDALEACISFLDAADLQTAKSVCRSFRSASESVLSSVSWRAAHMTLHELLVAPFTERRLRSSIAARAVAYPHELLQPGANGKSPQQWATGELGLGWPPAHVAALHNAPTHVLEPLLLAQGGVAARRRAHGQLPLHIAAQHSSTFAIGPLLRTFPGGAQQHDSRGALRRSRGRSRTSAVCAAKQRRR